MPPQVKTRHSLTFAPCVSFLFLCYSYMLTLRVLQSCPHPILPVSIPSFYLYGRFHCQAAYYRQTRCLPLRRQIAKSGTASEKMVQTFIRYYIPRLAFLYSTLQGNPRESQVAKYDSTIV